MSKSHCPSNKLTVRRWTFDVGCSMFAAVLCTATMLMAPFSATTALADPCGMVPPIYQGQGPPITRVGEQTTYVFFKDGVESFVIRPGFSGKVDEFGMLIPFPSIPELRKMPDHIFPHVAAAIDPPEVVIDVAPVLFEAAAAKDGGGFGGGGLEVQRMQKNEVRVVREEAVGMYEVAVLEAGSAAALKRWVDQHGYRYPDGMDKVCDEYVADGWCFVAVKTKVGQKQGVDPQPGQRTVDPQLPAGSTFDGHVQAMGFRFKTDELVVPMRLSAFNDGELRNIVYLLTDGPRRIRSIPEEYVVRQMDGEQLYRNVTDPLPLRIINGTEKDLQDWHRQGLAERRNPYPKNGAAKELFAADVMAVRSGQLSLPHEEREKELLMVGERLGLRGSDIDKLNADALQQEKDKIVQNTLQDIKEMTITVVDGDFPREVLAGENLAFAEYSMPRARNHPRFYDAKTYGPAPKQPGILKYGELGMNDPIDSNHVTNSRLGWLFPAGLAALASAGLIVLRRSRRAAVMSVIVAMTMVLLTAKITLAEDEVSPRDLIQQLGEKKTAQAAVDGLVAIAAKGNEQRERVVKLLTGVAREEEKLSKRGWAIAALAGVGGQDVDELLLNIHADSGQPDLVRTWAAAARVTMTRTAAGLLEKAALIGQFPSLGRPIGMRLVEQLNADSGEVSAEGLIAVTMRVPNLAQALAPAVLALGSDKLAEVLTSAKDQNVRRQAAGYLGTLAAQGDAKVADKVIDAYKFDVEATDVPWNGGPLFLPGINWQKENARALVGNLIRWHLWCDRNEKSAEKTQIHNNIRSLGLAQAAGYQNPDWQEADTVTWLTVWGKVVGRAELEKILKEQGVAGSNRYAAALNGLN